jgi:hypothetical protein
MKTHPKSVTLEASTDRIHADLRISVTAHPNRERGGAASFNVETRDGVPLATFHIGCQDAAQLIRELSRIFPDDWPLELADVPACPTSTR